MKFKLLIFILLMVSFCFSQQINHTWGYTTAGVAYTQIGSQDADGSTAIDIVFDLQDFHLFDWNPLCSDDSVIIGSSNKTYLGTFWFRFDAYNATDSVIYGIKSYAGNMIYHPNDDSRITASNINFSTTATTLVDTGATRAVNDHQWEFVNVYVNSSQDIADATVKHLPPEFMKISIPWGANCADSVDVYWDYVYWAIDETKQTVRKSTRSDGAARKQKETLH